MDMCAHMQVLMVPSMAAYHPLVLKPRISAPSLLCNFNRPVCLALNNLTYNSRLHPEFQKPSAMSAVKRVIKKLSTDGPVENLQAFTSFRTRRMSY
jgi:hypothetical protein